MTDRTGTYELGEVRLLLDGERVGTAPRVVREDVRRYQAETGRSEISFVPHSAAERFVSVDRAIGLARPKAQLHGA